jgi:CRISPR system Cascade subunit CasE
MYLSRLSLNLHNRQVQKELANRYELHRTLLRAFPSTLSVEERILYRLETDAHKSQVSVLIQSQGIPEWSVLPDGYLFVDAEIKPYEIHLVNGQTLIFRLLANPTRRIDQPGNEPGSIEKSKRVGLLKEEEQQGWIIRKSTLNGFKLISVRSTPQQDVVGYRQRQLITLQAVQFDGMLEVMDADLLDIAVRKGIGSGKGFGFGLLSLIRAS